MMKFNVTLLVCLFISACVGMPISSMLKLRNLEPLDTDPSSIRIAVITHKEVQLSNGSTSLSIGFSSEHPDFTFSNKFEASIINDAKVLELEHKKEPDQNITLFFLAEDAARSMQDAQNRIKDIRQRGIEGEGDLGIGIESGCFTGPRPNSIVASVYVKFNDQQGYILMNSGVDLIAMEEEIQQQFWVQCGTDKNPPVKQKV